MGAWLGLSAAGNGGLDLKGKPQDPAGPGAPGARRRAAVSIHRAAFILRIKNRRKLRVNYA